MKISNIPLSFPLSLSSLSYKLSFLSLTPLYSPSLSLIPSLSEKIATYKAAPEKTFATPEKNICIFIENYLHRIRFISQNCRKIKTA